MKVKVQELLQLSQDRIISVISSDMREFDLKINIYLSINFSKIDL